MPQCRESTNKQMNKRKVEIDLFMIIYVIKVMRYFALLILAINILGYALSTKEPDSSVVYTLVAIFNLLLIVASSCAIYFFKHIIDKKL